MEFYPFNILQENAPLMACTTAFAVLGASTCSIAHIICRLMARTPPSDLLHTGLNGISSGLGQIVDRPLGIQTITVRDLYRCTDLQCTARQIERAPCC